jgi:PAS domain-containing protein
MTPSQPLGFGDLGNALDAMREGLQVIDRQWRYVYLNNAAAVHGQRPREELVGRTMMECYPGIDETDVFSDSGHEVVASPRRGCPRKADRRGDRPATGAGAD